jgi:hypothetical protein
MCGVATTPESATSGEANCASPRRLALQHVDPDPKLFLVDRVAQSGLVDDFGARRVDEHRSILHRLEDLATHDLFGGVVQRQVKGQDVDP